jgi:hypothetical protein
MFEDSAADFPAEKKNKVVGMLLFQNVINVELLYTEHSILYLSGICMEFNRSFLFIAKCLKIFRFLSICIESLQKVQQLPLKKFSPKIQVEYQTAQNFVPIPNWIVYVQKMLRK